MHPALEYPKQWRSHCMGNPPSQEGELAFPVREVPHQRMDDPAFLYAGMLLTKADGTGSSPRTLRRMA